MTFYQSQEKLSHLGTLPYETLDTTQKDLLNGPGGIRAVEAGANENPSNITLVGAVAGMCLEKAARATEPDANPTHAAAARFYRPKAARIEELFADIDTDSLIGGHIGNTPFTQLTWSQRKQLFVPDQIDEIITVAGECNNAGLIGAIAGFGFSRSTSGTPTLKASGAHIEKTALAALAKI